MLRLRLMSGSNARMGAGTLGTSAAHGGALLGRPLFPEARTHDADPFQRMTATPEQALQRTAPRVRAPASDLRLPPAIRAPRRAPQSLSLGS